MQSQQQKTFRICCIGMMAAMAFASNYIRIPLGSSQIHVGNAVCVMCGLLFGPLSGFLSAGIGNLLYDLIAGYGLESLITFVSKGGIALVSALVIGKTLHKKTLGFMDHARLDLSCIAGALTYVALYMLKTFILGLTLYGLTMDATLVKMGTKLPASLINAAFASILPPILTVAVLPPLKKLGLFRMDGTKSAE